MSKADIIVKRNGEIRLPFHLFTELNKYDVIEHLQRRVVSKVSKLPIRNLTERSERYGKNAD